MRCRTTAVLSEASSATKPADGASAGGANGAAYATAGVRSAASTRAAAVRKVNRDSAQDCPVLSCSQTILLYKRLLDNMQRTARRSPPAHDPVWIAYAEFCNSMQDFPPNQHVPVCNAYEQNLQKKQTQPVMRLCIAFLEAVAHDPAQSYLRPVLTAATLCVLTQQALTGPEIWRRHQKP